MATAYLTLAISESDVNIANNTSSVQVTVYAYGNGVSWNNNAPGTVTVAGQTYSFNAKFTTSTGQQYLYTTPKKTITHNTDGTASVYCSAAFYTDTHDAGTMTTSRTFTLTTIPRATQPTVKPTSVALGNPVVISMPRASTNFLHGLTYKIGNLSGDLGTGLGESLTWSPPLTLAPAITGNSGTITFTCTTYSGGTVIGSRTVDLNVTLPASVPTVDPDEIIIGQSTIIKTNRISNVLTHTIRYSVGSDTGIIATNVTDMINWQPPLSLVKNISGSVGDVSVICDTYNGTALVGSSTVILRLVVDVQSTINSLLQFTKLTSTIDFEVERSSSFKGRIPLDSINTQDAFEELNEKIVPGGRVFEQLESVPLTLQNFTTSNYELTYREDKTYGFFVNLENKLLTICNMTDYTSRVYDFGIYDPLINSFSWGQDNSVWGVAKRSNLYYIVKINVEGGIFTYYALPNNFTNCSAFTASEVSNRLCIAVGGEVYLYNDIELTGGNIANINNWTKVGSSMLDDLWVIKNKFYGLTSTGYLAVINTDSDIYSSDRYSSVGIDYTFNNILSTGVVNNNKVVAMFDGNFRYSTNFFTSNTPTFTTVTVSGLSDNIARVVYSESDNRWYFYGIDENSNTKIYYISNSLSGTSVTSSSLNLNTDELNLVNIQSSKVLGSLGIDSNNAIEGILADGTVVSISSNGSLLLKGHIGITQGLLWKKIIRCNNQYIGLAYYVNSTTNKGTSFVVYSDNGITWQGGYSFDGVYDDIIFANGAIFVSGYSNNNDYLILCSTDYNISMAKNNNSTDMYNVIPYSIGALQTNTGIISGLAYDGANLVCTLSNRSEDTSVLAKVEFLYNDNGIDLNVITESYNGYLSNPISTAPNTFYFVQSNNRIASVFKYIYSTANTELIHEFVLNENSVALVTGYDSNEGIFYIILNNLVYDYRYLDVIIGNSQYGTSAMLYADGHYLYNSPTPTYSSSAFSSGYTIKGILNGEVATSITDCDSFIYLITPSGKGYYSKTIK